MAIHNAKALFDAADTLKALAAAATSDLVRDALEDARSRLVIHAADRLAWEIEQAQTRRDAT